MLLIRSLVGQLLLCLLNNPVGFGRGFQLLSCLRLRSLHRVEVKVLEARRAAEHKVLECLQSCAADAAAPVHVQQREMCVVCQRL